MTTTLRSTGLGGAAPDEIERFYDEHAYPPPTVLGSVAPRPPLHRRAAHHLIWPRRPMPERRRLLVAGCGTSQAVRHALLDPDAEVVAIDISTTAIDESRRLAEERGVRNLTLHRLAIEDVADLGTDFDQIVCTGVIHHLKDPEFGLRALRKVLAPDGAITLMVYAPYGRAGVYLIQEYCRRLGVGTSSEDIADLVATLREIPREHPIGRLLRTTRDFSDDDALADALLNPRDRAYSVPQLLSLLADAGLRFGRWVRQAPYLPDCGSISETPHSRRIAGLLPAEQYAALELFRGTMLRHAVIAFADQGRHPGNMAEIDVTSADAAEWRPIPMPTARIITERIPPGFSAALLNDAHTDPDLVLFARPEELAMFDRIDGRTSVAELGAGAPDFLRRLIRHDLIVLDASAGKGMTQ